MDKAYKNNDMDAAKAEQVFAGFWMAAAAQLVLSLLTSLLCTPQASIGLCVQIRVSAVSERRQN